MDIRIASFTERSAKLQAVRQLRSSTACAFYMHAYLSASVQVRVLV